MNARMHWIGEIISKIPPPFYSCTAVTAVCYCCCRTTWYLSIILILLGLEGIFVFWWHICLAKITLNKYNDTIWWCSECQIIKLNYSFFRVRPAHLGLESTGHEILLTLQSLFYGGDTTKIVIVNPSFSSSWTQCYPSFFPFKLN